jgi:hypothetical protein
MVKYSLKFNSVQFEYPYNGHLGIQACCPLFGGGLIGKGGFLVPIAILTRNQWNEGCVEKYIVEASNWPQRRFLTCQNMPIIHRYTSKQSKTARKRLP